VLKGRPLQGKLAGAKPHYQIHVEAAGEDHRIAINVMSAEKPSDLLYYLNEDFDHPVVQRLALLPEGFQSVDRQPGGVALDFIRGNLVTREEMKVLPHNVPGPDNDLHELFDLYVQRAIDRGADVYALGAKWGPEPGQPDQYFGFEPGNGIHDIHMNQGNSPQFKNDDGIWQDGGLFLHFTAENKWLAFFLAFQSQAWNTDEQGHTISGGIIVGPPAVGSRVSIIAALVNPPGDDVGHESVTLINSSPDPVSLNGWRLVSSAGAPLTLSNVMLDPGSTARVPLSGTNVQLSNKGGTITLLDNQGMKVHGVSYTKDDAGKQGWTVVF
jgi:uncharacterized protein YukJ